MQNAVFICGDTQRSEKLPKSGERNIPSAYPAIYWIQREAERDNDKNVSVFQT